MQKRVEVDGSSITVDVYGDPNGQAVVMIPGVLADAGAWRQVAERLESWQTVAVVNRRGRRPSGLLTTGYSLHTEIQDAAAVVRQFSDVRAVFGWSYGGLIALHSGNMHDVRHVIAYEPVIHPFGSHALPQLREAHDAADWDMTVEIATRQVSGMAAEVVETLRADSPVWAELKRLSEPIYAETLAIAQAPEPAELATKAGRVDLIVGQLNRGQVPYGSAFDSVARLLPTSTVQELPGQGHLGHLAAPGQLAALIDRIAARQNDRSNR